MTVLLPGDIESDYTLPKSQEYIITSHDVSSFLPTTLSYLFTFSLMILYVAVKHVIGCLLYLGTITGSVIIGKRKHIASIPLS